VARLHRAPLQTLIAAIVDGTFAPGDTLPREADLAERFGVSRATSREFLRALEDRGLITVKHGRGATVNPAERWDTLDADVLASLLAGPQSVHLLADFLETRRLFEVHAASLAAERADEHDVERLTAAFERMRDGASRPTFVEREYHEAEVAFHRTLVALTRNSTLMALSGRIHAAMLEPRYPLVERSAGIVRSLDDHERILRAISRGNAAAAARAMDGHLDGVEELLREYAADLTD
jgi:GntR family transcriptional repressor for pyruvate dehydrogenase complex